MKKVLWLVSWYPGKVDKFNGDFIQRHARATSFFCDVDVIYVVKDKDRLLMAGSEVNEDKNLHEKIIYYHSPKTGIRLLDRILSHVTYTRLSRQAVRKYINAKGKPHLVHVQIAMKAGMTALWIKKKWKIPFVVTENWTGYYRQSVPSVYRSGWFYRRMNKKILKEAAIFLPVTENLGETVKNNFADVPYKVIPNVVNTDLFYNKPVTLVKFRFIHFSYMNFQKNPEGILTAANRLKEMGHDFEVLMIGNNDSRLTDMARNFGMLNKIVFFKAAVPYDEVARQMQQASAFLLFSRFENLPCVILEALCCGLPVISSRVGGIAEVLSKENGILVENEHTDELTSAMKYVMENIHLYNRAEISERAEKKFNYKTVGKQIAEIYDQVSD